MTDPLVIRVEIPGEPKGVGRGRNSAGFRKDGTLFSKVHTPTNTRTQAGVIRMYAEQAMAGRPPISGPVELRMLFLKAVPKSMSAKHRAQALAGVCLPLTKPDFDNMEKFVDQFKNVIWTDDAIVAVWSGAKQFGERPMSIFEIRTMPGHYGWPIAKT